MTMRADRKGSLALGASAIGAIAFGAAAIGALAVGAVAIGALTIRRLRLVEGCLNTEHCPHRRDSKGK